MHTGVQSLALALVALATGLVLVVAGCGADGGGATASPTAATPSANGSATGSPDGTASPSPGDITVVNVYFLRDGMIGVARRTVPATTMPATAALTALLGGPNKQERLAGLTTAIPGQYELEGVMIKGGTAFVDLKSAALYKMSAEAAQRLLAQVVYTITQFSTVEGAVVTFNGSQLQPSGQTGALNRLLVRTDFDDVTPLIFVESPAVGETVSSPLTISGTANTFEGTFIAEIVDESGSVLDKEVVTATSGSGTRGTFSAVLKFGIPEGTSTLFAYEQSAEDGSRIHEVRIPLDVVVF